MLTLSSSWKIKVPFGAMSIYCSEMVQLEKSRIEECDCIVLFKREMECSFLTAFFLSITSNLGLVQFCCFAENNLSNN